LFSLSGFSYGILHSEAILDTPSNHQRSTTNIEEQKSTQIDSTSQATAQTESSITINREQNLAEKPTAASQPESLTDESKQAHYAKASETISTQQKTTTTSTLNPSFTAELASNTPDVTADEFKGKENEKSDGDDDDSKIIEPNSSRVLEPDSSLITPAPTTTVASTTTTMASTTTLASETIPPEKQPVEQVLEQKQPTQSSIVAGVVVNKAEMQSFEEWKEMKLKDAAAIAAATQPPASSSNSNQQQQHLQSQDQPKTVNGGESSSSNGGGSTNQNNGGSISNGAGASQTAKEQMNVAVAARRKNYASIDCGAKIIAHNPDASNPSHMLTESKDDYMLNSCSSRIWFVVELCEHIKIR
jgi:hypothetical protein